MKFAVFSDTHGSPEKTLSAIEHSSPDMVIHLGDGGRDITKIKTQFPNLPLKAVRGNCDISSSLPETETLSIGGIKLFLTHGHLFSVKRTPAILIEEALKREANIVLFGHTHEAVCYQEQGILVINPGTSGLPPMRTYAEIEISGDGVISSRILGL